VYTNRPVTLAPPPMLHPQESGAFALHTVALAEATCAAE
jgi:hypothetical protein